MSLILSMCLNILKFDLNSSKSIISANKLLVPKHSIVCIDNVILVPDMFCYFMSMTQKGIFTNLDKNEYFTNKYVNTQIITK